MAQVAPPQRPLAAPTAATDAVEAARRFLPPPGVHPNSAVFGAANLPKPLTWQRREHMVQRRSILGRIGQLLARNAQLVVQNDATATAAASNNDAHAKTWALARKLEVLIFLNSASLLEYNNVDSLARRVQAMTASIVNKKIRRDTAPPTQPPVQPRAAAAYPVQQQQQQHQQQSFTDMMHSPMVQPDVVRVPPALAIQPMGSSANLSRSLSTVAPGGSKRSASEMTMVMSAATSDSVQFPSTTLKRARHQLAKPMGGAAYPSRPTRLGHLLFQGFDEITKIVWSYVDGVQIMRSRAVSRTAHALQPLLVTSLQLSCNATLRALHTFSAASGACVLRACVNLKELEVVSLSSGMAFGKRSMCAMNCPQRFVVTHDDHEQIVLALSQQLRFNAFPRLTRLGLTCLFTNEEADGEADVLLNNLMTGCCPQLEELCLPGNSFGDYGALKIAQMLRARVCPKLTRLDLRRNFISEEGIRSVCHALADGCAPALVELCLGGNTITDSCFHHVLFAMESRQLSHLRFLGIEMNYLSGTSMEMLGRTIGKMVCPLLSQISYSDNSVDNADAKRLIATAVYQERMFRMRHQQLRCQQQLSDMRPHERLSMAPHPPHLLPTSQQQHPYHHHATVQPTHATMFPYTHEFPPASSLRMATTSTMGGFHDNGGIGGGGGAYMSEAPYSSADDDDDDDPYSSDGE